MTKWNKIAFSTNKTKGKYDQTKKKQQERFALQKYFRNFALS